MHEGTTTRRARRAAAAVACGALATATACGSADLPLEAETSLDGRAWVQVTHSPLSGRTDMGVYWTGDEVLVVGGTVDPPCPPNALCSAIQDLADGAAFDPATGEWRRIADSPVAARYPTGVVLDGDLYLIGRDASTADAPSYFLRYDPEADTWTDLPVPPRADERTLLVFGDSLVAFMFGHEGMTDATGTVPGGPRDIPDEIWDPATETWSDLPRDPLAPSTARFLSVAGDELHLNAFALGGDGTVDKDAVFRDGVWSDVPPDPGCDGVDPAQRLCVVHPDTGAFLTIPAPPANDPMREDFSMWAGDLLFTGDHVYSFETEQWRPVTAAEVLDREGVGLVWAGERAFAFGGATLADGEGDDPYFDATLEHDAWTWTPAG